MNDSYSRIKSSYVVSQKPFKLLQDNKVLKNYHFKKFVIMYCTVEIIWVVSKLFSLHFGLCYSIKQRSDGIAEVTGLVDWYYFIFHRINKKL